jgi:Uma2 family endonuclease
MALTVADRDVRPLTADEVMRMVELGILSENERVELLHGVLTEKAVKSPEHETLKERLVEWLAPGIAARAFRLRVEGAFIVPDRTSLPEPDLAVVERTDVITHPTTALLVIEVAWSSRRVDMTIKPPLFAAAGIPEMWVVDVEARRLETFTEPRDGAYTRRATLEAPAEVQPEAIAAIEPLALDALFAGLG